MNIVASQNYPTYKPNSDTHWKKLFVEQSIHNDSADDYDDKCGESDWVY